MKKCACYLLSLAAFILLLTACNAKNTPSTTTAATTEATDPWGAPQTVILPEFSTKEIDGYTLWGYTGEYYQKYLWNQEAALKNDQVGEIADEAQAIKVAKELKVKYVDSGLLPDGISKTSFLDDWVPKSVIYDDIDEVWIVGFAKDVDRSNPNMQVLSAEFSVHMRKDSGEVLYIGILG